MLKLVYNISVVKNFSGVTPPDPHYQESSTPSSCPPCDSLNNVSGIRLCPLPPPVNIPEYATESMFVGTIINQGYPKSAREITEERAKPVTIVNPKSAREITEERAKPVTIVLNRF